MNSSTAASCKPSPSANCATSSCRAGSTSSSASAGNSRLLNATGTRQTGGAGIWHLTTRQSARQQWPPIHRSRKRRRHLHLDVAEAGRGGAAMTTTSQRETFRTSRLLEFCSQKELVTQTGHSVDQWPLVILKELVDNLLDGCEETDVPPKADIVVWHRQLCICRLTESAMC